MFLNFEPRKLLVLWLIRDFYVLITCEKILRYSGFMSTNKKCHDDNA